MRDKPNFWKGNERICWLCVLMDEFIRTNSLECVPALMSGMASIQNASALEPARQAIFNLRQMSLAYVTTHSIRHSVALYNDRHYCNRTEGPYRIDAETLRFERTDFLEDPLITEARRILRNPMPYTLHTATVADPRQAMAVALGEESTSLRLPIGPITASLASRRTHNIDRSPRGTIRIPLAELRSLAEEMDERDALHPERRPGNWVRRFDHFDLMVPEIGRGLRKEDDTIELKGLKQLLGLPGAGKTTLLMLSGVWFGRHGYKAMLVFLRLRLLDSIWSISTSTELKLVCLLGKIQ